VEDGSANVVMAALVLAGLLLSACGPAATPSPTAAPAPTQPPQPTQAPAPTPTAAPKVKITFWEQESEEVDAFLDELVADFMKAHPNITVERVHYGNEELRDQFQAASLAGAAPELVRVPNDFAGPFSALGIIAKATDVFDKAFLDQFIPEALNATRVKGEIWGVPDNYGNHLMLLYNKDLVKEPPKDTDELIKLAQELTKGEVQGFAYNLNEPFWLAPWLGAFGAWPLDENDKPSFDNEGTVGALQFVQDLKFKHKVVPQECDYNCADTLFKEGKAAMIINGDWSLGGYAQVLGDKLGVAPIPKVTATGKYPTPMTGGKYWMVSKAVLNDPAKLEAVRTFVTYMTSADVQKKWIEKFKRLPSLKALKDDPAIQKDPILKGSFEQLLLGKPMPAAPEMRCAWDAMRPNLEGVMAGTLKPADAAKAMQQAADQCVAELGKK
jgi:arabinogalactan oligomer/maltooligosaccharide transport system substrate-binding protein